jgi:hypothetical protein
MKGESTLQSCDVYNNSQMLIVMLKLTVIQKDRSHEERLDAVGRKDSETDYLHAKTIYT